MRQYERALLVAPDDSELHLKCGDLLECHARNLLRQAVSEYEHAIRLNPNGKRADFHLHHRLVQPRGSSLDIEWPKQELERLRRTAGCAMDGTLA
ncbi:MAG: hypothetical protein JF887_06640 [Candidatus Dormibacteraeota bacterium]|uniref:Tetratricopeptide repeat protein n=1 Tax=Candidatus Amunia macphersoniae TaxID=3127014 RepID=A0A934KME0_9BACT|nr:hypothetical protein [Candidatus Dormibacteraeota bacterium]